jgi:hypothetical protein
MNFKYWSNTLYKTAKSKAVSLIYRLLISRCLSEDEFIEGHTWNLVDAEDQNYCFPEDGKDFSFTFSGAEERELPWLAFQRCLPEMSSQRRTTVFRNAIVAGETGTVLTSDKRIVLQNAYSSRRYLERSGNLKDILRSFLFKPEQDLECAISLLSPLCRNYYHWMIDVIPRLSNYSYLCEIEGRPLSLLVPSPMTSFMRDSLEMLGIPRERWIPLTARRVAVSRLYVPEFWGNWRNQALGQPIVYAAQTFESLAPLNSNFASEATAKPTEFIRVCIERENTQSRGIKNWAEVKRYLKNLGFRFVHLEKLSLTDQRHLFREANIVVGCHGAGFTNMIFSRPGTKFIEFFPRPFGLHKENVSFYQLTRWFRLHQYLFCFDPIDSELNIFVDQSCLKAVESIVNSQE